MQELLDDDEIRALLDRMSIKGDPNFRWTFSSLKGEVLTHWRTDDLNGRLDSVSFLVPVTAPARTEAALAFAAYVGYLWILEHEGRERFLVDGEQVVYPHATDGTPHRAPAALSQWALAAVYESKLGLEMRSLLSEEHNRQLLRRPG